MKHARLWIVGIVAAAVVVATLAIQRHATGNRHEDNIPAASRPSRQSVAQEAISDPEVARVVEIGHQWRGLTVEAVKGKYQIIQETNQVPWVLDVTAKDRQNGDEVRLSFGRGTLYEVHLTRTNGSAYHMFLYDEGRVGQYMEWTNRLMTGLAVQFYTNGQLNCVVHQSNAFWLGPARFYSETGDLILSTNYTQPTVPEMPPQLRPRRSSSEATGVTH
jgi:hypothetical protein